jgi:hypothetical protein
VSVDPGPPIPPPQLSPDGKWVWDGTQWQPIADSSEPVHKGVFAAWNSIQVEPADPVADLAQRAPMQIRAPVPLAVQMSPPMEAQAPQPEIDYSYTVNDPTITPLWLQPKSSGVTKYLYFGAGLVVVVIVLMLLNSLNFVSLPFIGASSGTQQAAKPSPTPSAYTPAPVRSEFSRADGFLNGSLGPAIDSLAQPITGMQSCNGTLSNACFDAMNAASAPLKNVLVVIDKGPIPQCIAAPMKGLRADFVNMQTGLTRALKGYNDNQRAELDSGLYAFVRNAQALPADAKAVDQAQKTLCSTDPEGP